MLTYTFRRFPPEHHVPENYCATRPSSGIYVLKFPAIFRRIVGQIVFRKNKSISRKTNKGLYPEKYLLKAFRLKTMLGNLLFDQKIGRRFTLHSFAKANHVPETFIPTERMLGIYFLSLPTIILLT